MIKIVKSDIWKFLEQGRVIVVPTNGYVNKDGKAVMGKGLAHQASKLFRNLDFALGNQIKKDGSNVFYFPRQRLIMFPTKDNWKNPAEIDIIINSCKALKRLMEVNSELRVAMPKVGCGWGKLEWDKDVAPIILQFFGSYDDKRFVIVDNEQGDAGQDFRGDNLENIKGSTDKSTGPRIVNADGKFITGL